MSSYLAHKRKGFQGSAPAAFNGFGNRSRSFDGVDDKVTIAVDPVDDEPITISAWVKLDTTTQVGGIFNIEGDEAGSGNEGFGLLVVNGEFWAYSQEVGIFDKAVSTSTLNTTEWWHVCGVFRSPTDREIYINGTSEGTNTTSVNPSTTIIDNACIGNRANTNNDQDFSGKIADVRIYDTDLTASQISDLYAGTNITTNLVGNWLTDADNLLDAAGSNNGTNYGSKYSYDNPSPPVEFGSASRDFNGSTDYVNLGQTTDNAIFTASAWVKFNSNNSLGEGIFGKWQTATNGAWLLYTQSTSNYLTFIVRNSANDAYTICTSGIVRTLGQWTHIAGVADGTNLTIYINGVSAASIAYDGTINNPTSDTVIGAYNNTLNNNHHVDGKIADVRLYDTDLTASQVSDLYAGTDVQTNLVGHWLTDNDDVEDKAGTNDGTNFGSTYSYDNPPMDLIPFGQRSRRFASAFVNTNAGFQSVFQSSFSISTWVTFDDGIPASSEIIFGNQSAAPISRSLIFLDNAGALTFSYFSNGNQARAEIDQNFANGDTGWFHYTAVVEPTGITIYKDGSVQTLDATDDGDMSAVTMGDYGTDIDCYIGARNLNGSPDLNMTGNIADFRIYDSALSASDVAKIYNRTDDKSNIYAWYLTNSDDVLDHAGTNDGTNNGSTYSTDSPS